MIVLEPALHPPHNKRSQAMDPTQRTRSHAATGQPMNLHAVQRERPDMLDLP